MFSTKRLLWRCRKTFLLYNYYKKDTIKLVEKLVTIVSFIYNCGGSRVQN